MSIASRIESIEEHIANAYDSIESLGVDITGVNKNIENISSSIDGIYDTLPKVTGEGESISLDGTIKGRLKSTLKGNTSQNGTPTPDTPIPVNVVSGDNEVNVIGKNIFDKTKTPIYNIRTTLTQVENGLNVSRTGTTGGFVLIPVGNISDYVGKKLTFSYDTNYKSEFRASGLVNCDASGGNRTTIQEMGNTNLSFTTTLANSYSQPILAVRIYLESDATVGTEYLIKNIQLEVNDSKTDYEPYNADTYPINLPEGMELCKIGTYQDYFYKDSGKWYLHKEVGKVILDGSETWSFNGSSGLTRAYTTTVNDVKIVDNSNNETLLICSCFVGNSANYAINRFVDYLSAIISNKRLYAMFNNTTFPDANSIKTYFTNNNATLYIVLNTPTDNEVTYTPLIDQLNELEKAMSYNGQTNISQVNNDLPFIISASALKEWSE